MNINLFDCNEAIINYIKHEFNNNTKNVNLKKFLEESEKFKIFDIINYQIVNNINKLKFNIGSDYRLKSIERKDSIEMFCFISKKKDNKTRGEDVFIENNISKKKFKSK